MPERQLVAKFEMHEDRFRHVAIRFQVTVLTIFNGIILHAYTYSLLKYAVRFSRIT